MVAKSDFLYLPTRPVAGFRAVMAVVCAVAFAQFAFCPAGGRAEAEPERPASLTAETAGDKPVVYFGVISRYHPVVMYKEYYPIMHYLTQNTPYRFELKLPRTYVEAVSFLEEGITQVASLGAVTYLEAHARFGAVPILRPVNDKGEAHYRSIIVVREDSDIRTLEDLKGRTFAFASMHSTSGNLYGRYVLKQAGIDLADLKAYTNYRHHDQVTRAVLAGDFDAGSVKDIVARRYEQKGLRFIHVSGPIPSVPIVVRPDTPAGVIEALKEALLRIDVSDQEYARMTKEWNEEFRYGFVEATDADYASVRDLMNQIPEKCGSVCHPVRRF